MSYPTQPDPAQTSAEPPPAAAGRTQYAPGEARDPRQYSEWDPRSAPGTYFLVAVNVAVFLWMILHGVSARDPSVQQLQHFGANNPVLVLNQHQWYRVLTATFVHIGILHIASNMWCLWNLGLLGEPLVGPWGLIAVYVLTGVAGNLLSLAWDAGMAVFTHTALPFGMGAGASGAVFGLTGILIVLLSNRKLPIPWSELKRLRTSVVRFAAINLFIGASTIIVNGPVRVDNSAHIGGFLAGLALGPPLVPMMTAGRERYLGRQKTVFLAAAFILCLFGYWIANLKAS